MKKGLTELVFVVDKSGSMSGLEGDTIGGFNSMLKEQQDIDGEAYVTTILFDNSCELLHDRIDIHAVSPMTREDYKTGGGTALLDALGIAMHKIRKVHESMKEDYRPEKTMFVIITDGQENSSRHYSFEMIRERTEKYKKEKGWEFVFFGANMDAIAEAAKIGIAADFAHGFVNDRAGIAGSWAAMSNITGNFRKGIFH